MKVDSIDEVRGLIETRSEALEQISLLEDCAVTELKIVMHFDPRAEDLTEPHRDRVVFDVAATDTEKDPVSIYLRSTILRKLNSDLREIELRLNELGVEL